MWRGKNICMLMVCENGWNATTLDSGTVDKFDGGVPK